MYLNEKVTEETETMEDMETETSEEEGGDKEAT